MRKKFDMLEIIKFVGEGIMVSRSEIVDNFGERAARQVSKSVGTIFRSTEIPKEGYEDKVEHNKKIDDEISKYGGSGPNEKKRAALRKEKISVPLVMRYRLHKDFIKTMRGLFNHTASGTIENDGINEFKEYIFSPLERVKIKIGPEIFFYTPEYGFTCKGIRMLYGERLDEYRKKIISDFSKSISKLSRKKKTTLTIDIEKEKFEEKHALIIEGLVNDGVGSIRGMGNLIPIQGDE